MIAGFTEYQLVWNLLSPWRDLQWIAQLPGAPQFACYVVAQLFEIRTHNRFQHAGVTISDILSER